MVSYARLGNFEERLRSNYFLDPPRGSGGVPLESRQLDTSTLPSKLENVRLHVYELHAPYTHKHACAKAFSRKCKSAHHAYTNAGYLR